MRKSLFILSALIACAMAFALVSCGDSDSGDSTDRTVPIITDVSPEEVKTGQEIRIIGASFGATQGTSALTIGGVPALPADIVSWGEYEIRAKVPAGASTGIVTLTVAGVRSSPGFFVLLWTNENPVNAAVSTATSGQSRPAIVPDGTGGAIIAWQDIRNGTDYDIYARRVDASGNPLWTVDGVAICTAPFYQEYPWIVPDGTGGAIIAWEDHRGGNADIYAQRVDASGSVKWTTDGIAVSAAANNQHNPTIAPDGAGGAIITWQDYRGGNTDIYAQRVDANGAVKWMADGVAICTAANNQHNPTIAPDGAGGAIIAWKDNRGGGNTDIYAQRVDANGAVKWMADGVAICTDPFYQEYPWIAPDGAGGAIIAWEDYRDSATTSIDIYVQRVDASGNVKWTVNGAAVSKAMNAQIAAHVAPDGTGGAFIAWMDYRNSETTSIDIYVQRVNAWGNSLLTTDGVAISTAPDIQSAPVIAPDGEGGAIIAWQDMRNGTDYDIYTQGISASGRQ